jgi:hypothetical protein
MAPACIPEAGSAGRLTDRPCIAIDREWIDAIGVAEPYHIYDLDAGTAVAMRHHILCYRVP